jgi:hypothetical protein
MHTHTQEAWFTHRQSDIQGHLQHLRKLRVLKLVFHELGYQRFYSGRVYHEAAETFFNVLGRSCPQLTAVILESRCDSGVTAWNFVRSAQIDGRLQAKFLGEDVAPYVIKDYEPCSDMLEPEKLIFG